MMVPPKVSRSTMAAQSLESVKVLVQPEKDCGRDRDGRILLALGQDLKEQLGAAAVQLHVPEFVDAQQIDPSVARDGLRQRLLVGGLDQFVGELGASGYLTRKPDIAASVPSAIRRWDLPLPESPI
jgi:hypothetical protein